MNSLYNLSFENMYNSITMSCRTEQISITSYIEMGDEGVFILEFNSEWLEKSICSKENMFEDVILLYEEMLNVFNDVELENRAL